jgi:hypothetical protein
MEKLTAEAGRRPAVPAEAPDAPLPAEYWDSLLKDPRAGDGGRMRQRKLSEVQRHVLRISCRRCERTVEIQTADAIRLYGKNAVWKQVAQRLLDDTCQRVEVPGNLPHLCAVIRPRKDLAMFRLLSILALSALCTLPDRVSADAMKPHESLASEISSRQRCACSTWRIHHRRYRSIRTAYLIGYDPLPYRFGTSTVWGPPYRYYWR